jgi:hypothetical protein
MTDVRIYVQFEKGQHYSGSCDYAHFTARPLVWGCENYGDRDGAPSLFSPDSYSIDVPQKTRELSGLEISGQIDERPNSVWYGWHVGYRKHLIELRDAESVLRVLRTVDRSMRKISEEYGAPVDMAAYVTHAVKTFTSRANRRVYMRDLRPDEPDFDGTGYRSMDTDALRWWLADQVMAWRKERGHDVSE